MGNHSYSKKVFLLPLIIVILGSLACTMFSGRGSNSAAQQTIVALEQTKEFLESQPTQVIIIEVTPEGDHSPTETLEPIIAPTADPTIPPDVDYEGIQFSFDQSIAESVITATIPGQNLGDNFMPFETYPTHFELSFTQYAVDDHFHVPKILIFPVDEFRSISSSAHDQFNLLESVLVNRPGSSAISNLPFLPLWPAAQIFSAQIRYFDFQNGSGIRYLTMYAQDAFPVDNQNLIYTYQGITDDGRYYISVIMPITHPGLPDDGYAEIQDDYMGFINNWEIYLLDTIRFLGEQPLDSYSPSIARLDDMIASLSIKR